jgi:hypothetical protein
MAIILGQMTKVYGFTLTTLKSLLTRLIGFKPALRNWRQRIKDYATQAKPKARHKLRFSEGACDGHMLIKERQEIARDQTRKISQLK